MQHKAIQFVDLTLTYEQLRGFSGCITVGNHVLFAPLMNGAGIAHGHVVRITFDDPYRVEYLDLNEWFDGARGFVGVVGDGRYAYFVPYHNLGHHGLLVRYDTSNDFHDRDSWERVDLQQLVSEHAKGYVSGSFDGRFLYLAPYQADWTHHHGNIARYDTHAAFDDPASWNLFDASSLDPDARGFHGAVSTNKFTWFIPYVLENRNYHGHLVRHSHQNPAGFSDPDCWMHFDLTQIYSEARGYVGGCHDGHFLYMAPYFNGKERHGLVLQHDTSVDMSDPEGWKAFDLTGIHPSLRGFFGAIPYRNHIYFLPHCKEEGVYHGTLARYDRSLPFDDAASWSFLDTTEYHPMSKGFIGCSLLGNLMILSPYETASYAHSGLVCTIDLDLAPFSNHFPNH